MSLSHMTNKEMRLTKSEERELCEENASSEEVMMNTANVECISLRLLWKVGEFPTRIRYLVHGTVMETIGALLLPIASLDICMSSTQ